MCKASIRSHLLLLVLAVSVPLVAIVGLGIYADTQQTINQTKNSLRMHGTTPSFQTFLKARSFSVGEPFFDSI